MLLMSNHSKMCYGIVAPPLSEIMRDIRAELDYHLQRDNTLPVRCLIYSISYFGRRWAFEDFKFDSPLLCYLDLYIEDCYCLLIGGERLAKLLTSLKDYEYYNDLSLVK